jgi:DNA-directed RNA polymerase specialized sigma24 family protein
LERRDFIDARKAQGQRMEATMRVLYRQFGRRLVRGAGRVLGSAAQAEDTVREAFIKAFRNCAQLRGAFDVNACADLPTATKGPIRVLVKQGNA